MAGQVNGGRRGGVNRATRVRGDGDVRSRRADRQHGPCLTERHDLCRWVLEPVADVPQLPSPGDRLVVPGPGLISDRIERLAQGHMGDAKVVGNGVTELRVHFGPGYRVYITQRGATLIVLLCGGEKRSQARDLDRAIEMARKLEK